MSRPPHRGFVSAPVNRFRVLAAGFCALILGGCGPTDRGAKNPVSLASAGFSSPLSGVGEEAPSPAAEAETAAIFLRENTDGTDDGVARLLAGMEAQGTAFYRRGAGPGIIGAEDVVLIKINSQWAERGGTNTDLLKGLIQYIVDHPEGFKGEVVIADNGQSMFGSARTGGSLDWDKTNSRDRTQSAQDVADYFDRRSYRVSGVLWDTLTRTRVREFEAGDTQDGFVVEDGAQSTGLIVSYAKFTTKYGTAVSFKRGIWNSAAKQYDSDKLKVLNVPVLKSHGQYQVTGAVKSYMGTPSNSLTNMAAHNSVGRGGMGTQMAKTRFPALNILDMIYLSPEGGPSSTYTRAVQKNMIAASADPVALDYWASKNVLIPAAEAVGNRRAASMSPDGKEPGSFGYWLRLSMEELRRGGYPVTMDEARIRLYRIP